MCSSGHSGCEKTAAEDAVRSKKESADADLATAKGGTRNPHTRGTKCVSREFWPDHAGRRSTESQQNADLAMRADIVRRDKR